MGNESSSPVADNVAPRSLESRTLDGIAKYVKAKGVNKVVVMTGAGISTSAGIPDFRSPGTGLYANLARLDLPYAEAVFDISYFRNNPVPFYTLAHELYPGRYRPTVTHCFIRLLHDKGQLLKLFTQNIDCLEREAGVPDDMIVEAHGSFASQRCIECKTEFPHDRMQKTVQAREVPRCLTEACDGLVKPDIVFFGEALPEIFLRNRTLPASADLAIVMGTSLTVQPFASLPSFVREDVPRILINLEAVGGLGSRPDDVLLLEGCDSGVRKLAEALGWLDELDELWKRINPEKHDQEDQLVPPKTMDEKLEAEVDQLTRNIYQTLKVSRDHTSWLQGQLEERRGPEPKGLSPSEHTPPSPSEHTPPSPSGLTDSAAAEHTQPEDQHDQEHPQARQQDAVCQRPKSDDEGSANTPDTLDGSMTPRVGSREQPEDAATHAIRDDEGGRGRETRGTNEDDTGLKKSSPLI